MKNFLFVLLILLSCSAIAQSPVEKKVKAAFAGKKITAIDFTQDQYGALVKADKVRGKYFWANKKKLNTILVNKPNAVSIILPYRDDITIDLVKADIFTDDFKVIDNKTKQPLKIEQGVFYRGIVRGKKSLAAISIFSNRMDGIIIIDGQKPIDIGADKANQSQLVAEESEPKEYVCKTPPPTKDQLEAIKRTPRYTVNAVSPKCVTNFWEVSYNLYQKLGSSLAVNNFISALFNNFALFYANENIAMKLSTISMWTQQDPYNDDLGKFSSTRVNFGASLAMLLSATGGGGVAWLNTVCDNGDRFRHSFCGSIDPTVTAYPQYTWNTNVTCHEVGHNLGSPHTHACAWNGNNTAIDGCGPKVGYSEGCDTSLPVHGTIMSYCHLVRGIGIDLTLGFGKQPGDLIRGVVNNCAGLTCSNIDTVCRSPTNPKATGITTTSAVLSWTTGNAIDFYNIWLSVDGITFVRKAIQIRATTYNLTNLQPNTTYTFYIVGRCLNGKNKNSVKASFRTLQ